MCDIFISYRRNGGFEPAQRLYESLVKRGFSVSFDLETLRSGSFDRELMERIELCRDFVLIVDKHCFDKTLDKKFNSENDWVRREVAYALQLKKNVITVKLPGADFPDDLPEDIAEISMKNGPEYSPIYFEAFVSRLEEQFFYSRPVSLPGRSNPDDDSHPVPRYMLKIGTDIDCTFYLDTVKTLVITKEKRAMVPLKVGEYELKFVSLENEADCFVDVFNMVASDKLYNVSLDGIRKARIEKEEKERKEREERERAEKERLEQERIARERMERERVEHERFLAKERERRIAEMGAINGIFSVDPQKQVLFSKGNLQYQASTKTWRFAEQQYDFRGVANRDISPDNPDWIDLFGWGTGNKPTKSSLKFDDYASIVDWGKNVIANGGQQANLWRTLSIAEWEYLFRKRETASGICFAKARVNGTNGILLFPDNWNKAVYNIKKPNQGDAEFMSNRISAADWKALESYGMVFIPAAGYRSGSSVDNAGLYGYYWSASYYYSKCAFSLDFCDSNLNLSSNHDRSYGRSVRLVCSAD